MSRPDTGAEDLQVAFDAGRQFERIVADQRADEQYRAGYAAALADAHGVTDPDVRRGIDLLLKGQRAQAGPASDRADTGNVVDLAAYRCAPRPAGRPRAASAAEGRTS